MSLNFYAHFNPTTNRIEAVKQTPETKGKLVSIPITEEQATKILIDNCSILDLTLGYTNEEISLVEKIDANVVNRMEFYPLIQIKECDKPSEMTLRVFKDKFEIEVNQQLPFLVSTEFSFFLTAKNDPTRLIEKFSIDIGELSPKTSISFIPMLANDATENTNALTINTDIDYRDCSIFTIKKFKSYGLEIIK